MQLTIIAMMCVLAAGCGSGAEDVNLRRGRELLARGEPDAAVRELRLAVKDHPRDGAGRALLLVALQRTDGELASWYEGQILFDRLQFLRDQHLDGLDGYAQLEQLVTEIRRELYDKGLDTRDAGELACTSRDAAHYSLTVATGATDEERDYAAFALALDGDAAAVARLVERLKSAQADYIPGLLARSGNDVEAALMAEVAHRESLARPRALDTLARMRERQVVEALFREAPTWRGLADDDVAAALRGPVDAASLGFSRDQAMYGMQLHGDDEARLRRWWVPLTSDGATRLLVLQAFDTGAKAIVTRAYRFIDGRIAPLTLPAIPELASEGTIASVTVVGADVVIRQIGRGQVPVQVERAQPSYQPGDRVRVRSIGKDGVVAGRDEFGLLTVRLDSPHRGLASMAVTPAAVRALVTELAPQVGYRTYTARVDGARLTMTAAPALAPLEDSP